MKKMLNTFKITPLLDPTVVKGNDAVHSEVVDCFGFDAATLLVHVGATEEELSADKNVVVQLESSSTGADHFQPVRQEEIRLTSPEDTEQLYLLSYTGPERYIRVRVSCEGEQNEGTQLSISALLMLPHLSPVRE